MTDRIRTIFTLIFIQTVIIVKGQYGLFELTIKLTDKKENKIINDSILSSLVNDSLLASHDKSASIAFETSNFYVPMDPVEKQKRIKENNLSKRELIGLKVAIEWDTQKNEAIILGYAPIYSLTPKSPFFFSGNFNRIFNEQHYKIIKTTVQSALLHVVNNSTVKSKEVKSTIRQINIADFDCIYHVELNYLPQRLLTQWKSGNLVLYEDYQLTLPIDYSQDLLTFAKDIKTFCVYEQWTDTTILNKDFGPNPLPFDTDYLKRKTVAIGLILPNKKIAWLNYEAYKFMLTKSKDTSDHYKFTIYDLYFQSSFCRQMKMDMIIK